MEAEQAKIIDKIFKGNIMDESHQKGREGEAAFRAWLNERDIPYLHIEQHKDSLSRALGDIFGAKRPDFMILVPRLGFILVDVKHRAFVGREQVLSLNLKDIQAYVNLEKHFNFKVWFAFSNDTVGYQEWYWISVARFRREAKPKRIPKGRKWYTVLEVPQQKFITIGSSDSQAKLYEKLIFKNLRDT